MLADPMRLDLKAFQVIMYVFPYFVRYLYMASSSTTQDPTATMYDHLPGSTMIPSVITTNQVVTGEVTFKDGSKAKGVSQDYTENHYQLIPSSRTLKEAIVQLQANIDQIDPDNNFFQDQAVISKPLIDEHFSITGDKPWEVEGWSIINHEAIYQQPEDGTLNNFLKIPNSVFTSPGYYHLHIVTNRLDSGRLVVTDASTKIIAVIADSGDVHLEMYVTNPSIMVVRIQAQNVYQGDVIKITSVSLHEVKTRFRDYLSGVLTKLGIHENGLQDVDVRRIFAEEIVVPKEELKADITSVNQALLVHMSESGNVHHTTPEAIGAAPKNHSHPELETVVRLESEESAWNAHVNDTATNPHCLTPAIIGAASVNHTHPTYERILQSAEEHISNTRQNPHNVTCAMIGAATANHTHPEYALVGSGSGGGSSISDETMQLLNSRIEAAYLKMDSHIGNILNPHQVTAAQIGAALSTHTHTPEEIHAASDTHTHSLDELQAASVSHTHTAEEIGAAASDHSHHPDDIGAARALHFHIPEEIGAADRSHIHSLGELGAASANHTHTLTSLRAASVDHTHDLEDLGAAERSHSHTAEEVGASPSNHTHTLASLNAARADHTHTPEEIGAAPLRHSHTADEVGDLFSAIDIAALGAAPVNHTHTLESLGAASATHVHTYLDVGAAALVHTHTAVECGAASVDHSHDLESLNAASVDHTHTLNELGAAAFNHTHLPSDIGASATDHTHTPEEIGAAPIVHSHTPEEVGAASVDHTHALESLGASPSDHTHIPEDIGAAAIDHTHDLSNLGVASVNHTHTLESLGAAAAVHTHSLDELQAASINHTHTDTYARIDHTHSLDSLNAASIDHTHTPESINAATINHTHIPSEIGASEEGHTHSASDIGAAAIDHSHDTRYALLNHTHSLEDLGAAEVNHVHDLEALGAASVTHTHTADEVNAASIDHTHTPEEIGAASIIHTHIPDEVGAAPLEHDHDEWYSSIEHTHTLQSLEAASIDHTHTPEEIGAASYDHTHSLEELNAAGIDHTHSPLAIGAADIDHTHTAEEVGAANVNHTHTPEEIGAASYDHSHNLETLGAAAIDHTHDDIYASIDHTHTLAELNAASANHIHPDLAAQSTIENVQTSVTDLDTRVTTLEESTLPTEVEALSSRVQVLSARIEDVNTNQADALSSFINEYYLNRRLDLTHLDLVTVDRTHLLYPSFDQKRLLTPPAITLYDNGIVHTSATNFDYYSGKASCNKACTPLACYAFSHYFESCATFTHIPFPIDPVTLTYTFPTPRRLTAIRIYRDRTTQEGDGAKVVDIYLDDTLYYQGEIDLGDATTWDQLTVGHEYILPEVLSISKITVVVSERTAYTTDLTWSIFVDTSFETSSTVEEGYKSVQVVSSSVAQADKTLSIERAIVDLEDTSSKPYIYRHADGSLSLSSIPPANAASLSGLDVASLPMSTWSSSTELDVPLSTLFDGSLDTCCTSTIGDRTSWSLMYTVDTCTFLGVELIWSNNIPFSSIPTTVTVEAVDSEENVMWYKESYIVPDFEEQDAYILTLESAPISHICRVTITFLDLDPTQEYRLTGLRLYARYWSRSTTTGSSSDSDMVPFGRIESVTSLVSSTKYIRQIGLPAAPCMTLPIEHYSKVSAGEYVIPNPYCTLDVDLTLFKDGVKMSTILTPSLTDITITVTDPGRYAVRIHRLW